MLLTLKAQTLKEQLDDVAHKQTTPHTVLATRLSHTLCYDHLLLKHFVSNIDGSYKFATTAEEGSVIQRETDLCAVSGDGSVVAFLKSSPFVTPLYTNPNYSHKLDEIRKKLNTPTCRIFAYTGNGSAYSKRRTIEMKSEHYSQILLTDDGGYLIALTTSLDGSYIEVYAKQANTYKHVCTFGNWPHHMRTMINIASDSKIHTNPRISSIGLLGDRLGLIVRYTKQRGCHGYFNDHLCPTHQLITVSLEDLIADKVEHFYSEKVDRRVTSGDGVTNYEFIGDCTICYITDYAREERVTDVYIFDKNNVIIHSVSLDYLRKQAGKQIELNIAPFSFDKITKPIILTI